jgi:tyrosine-protein phosphatase YwqE
MVELHLAHVIASDAHSAGHRRPQLSSVVAVAAQLMGSRQEAENMVTRTPRAIISGQVALLHQPGRPREKKQWYFSADDTL